MAMSAAKTANKKPGSAKKKPSKPRERVIAPEDIVEVPDLADTPEFDYVLKPKDPAPVDVAAALQVSDQAAADAAAEEASTRKGRDWYSGWCSSGMPGAECRDGSTTNKAGEVIRRCRYVGVNGIKVVPREVYCACSCHRDPERAGQALERDLNDVETA